MNSSNSVLLISWVIGYSCSDTHLPFAALITAKRPESVRITKCLGSVRFYEWKREDHIRDPAALCCACDALRNLNQNNNTPRKSSSSHFTNQNNNMTHISSYSLFFIMQCSKQRWKITGDHDNTMEGDLIPIVTHLRRGLFA